MARVAHSDIPATGAFGSSEPWLNRLFANIDWGQRGNFISVPTDCPQRDERLGWLGAAQIFARTACYNRDVAAFFAKWLDDVADAQHESGAFADVAPSLNQDHAAAPAWSDAGVIIPWTLYLMYADRGILQRHLAAMSASGSTDSCSESSPLPMERDADSFTLRIGLPPNVTASVRVPSSDAGAVQDSNGRPPAAIAPFPGSAGAQEAIFEVGSGTHEFHGLALPG